MVCVQRKGVEEEVCAYRSAQQSIRSMGVCKGYATDVMVMVICYVLGGLGGCS